MALRARPRAGTSDYTGTDSGSYTFSYTDYQASWNISYTWTDTTTYSQCSLASQYGTTATTATVNGTNAISVPRAGIPETDWDRGDSEPRRRVAPV